MEPEIKRLKDKIGIELLWIYILALLKKKSSHSYLLRKKIEKEFGFLPGEVTVYVVMYKLKSRGYVSSKKDENKIVYSITKKGNELLKTAEKIFNEKTKKIFKQ
ncbi:MAG: PadR family transcriptional regulator [Candidatus Diapherotrites archaeon CG10_big_fil_rev_8_21_14_0_10_31_34]|nr:MAG: PadR family transcriptional regulator [Candidatus Diapherotrites archaeon CG10_big_fil_rev_8_21_14_0_10_31_34]